MDAGARVIHVDVMDGHFVPPISIGALIVDALRDQVHDAGGVLDVHLMVERPELRVEDFAKAGADVDHGALGGHAERALRAPGGRERGLRARPRDQPGDAARGGRRPGRRVRPPALHDGQPRLGRPALHRALDREGARGCASCCPRACRSRWTAASTSARPAPRPRRARRCSSPARRSSASRIRPRRIPGSWRPRARYNSGRVRGRGVLIGAAMAFLVLPASANAGHLLTSFDHAPPSFVTPTPPSPAFQAGGKGAKWELVTTLPSGNPHTDLDFFTQGGDTFASVGTLAIGPNGGGQTILQLTDGGTVAPKFVSTEPTASCISQPDDALGLQHDVEATPKGNAILNTDVLAATRTDTQLLIDATDAPGPLPRPGRPRHRRRPAGRPRDHRRHRRREPGHDRPDQPHRRGAHGQHRSQATAHRVRGHLRRGQRRRRRQARQRDRRQLRRAGPRRVRGRGPVLVHELPVRHDARAEARRAAGRRSSATATRAPRCRSATPSRAASTAATSSRSTRATA